MASLESGQGGGMLRVRGLFTRRRVIVATCLVAVAAVALLLLLWSSRSPVERLRAIDAAYAIPEEENAASDYTKLAWGYSGPSLNVVLLQKSGVAPDLLRPWRSADYLPAATWLADRRPVIDALMDISRKPNCWFSLVEDGREAHMQNQAASEWSSLLLMAANNDLGDGRREAGLEKLLCVLRLAQHFRTQISPEANYLGRGLLWDALPRFNRLVLTEEVPSEWLTRFEAALPPAEGGWTGNDRQAAEIGWLYEQQTKRSLITRLTSILDRARDVRQLRWMDLLEVGRCRASRILLAARRYRNDTGRWPANLQEIEGRIPPETLIDPLSGKRFAYRLTEDSLILDSAGPYGAYEFDLTTAPPGQEGAADASSR